MKSLKELCLIRYRQQFEDGDVGCGFLDKLSAADADELFIQLKKLAVISYFITNPLFDAALTSFKFPLISGKDVGRVDIFLSSNLLTSFKHLVTLNISDSAVSDYGICYLATANMMALHYLDISRCPHITMNGMNVLAGLQTLKVLHMDEFEGSLTEWLLPQSFQELSLQGLYNELPISVLKIIVQTSSLTLNKFYVTSTEVSDRLWYTQLPSFQALQELSIRIPQDRAVEFMDAISNISTLKKLSTNAYASDMVNALLTLMLANNIHLSSLSLHVPDLREDEFLLLSQMTSLESLHLKHTLIFLNKHELHETTTQYLFARLINLKELNLERVQLWTFQLEQNIEIFPRNLEVLKVQESICYLFDEPLYTTLSCMTHLRVLHLDYHKLCHKEARFLWYRLAIFNLPHLEEIYITKYRNFKRHFLQALFYILNLCPKNLKVLSFNFGGISRVDESLSLRNYHWPVFPRLEYLYLPPRFLYIYKTELCTIQEMSFSPYTQLLPIQNENKTDYFDNKSKESHAYSEAHASNVTITNSYKDIWNIYTDKKYMISSPSSYDTNEDNDIKVNPNFPPVTNVCEKYHTLPPSTDTLGEGMSIAQIYECRHHITSQYKPCHMLPRKETVYWYKWSFFHHAFNDEDEDDDDDDDYDDDELEYYPEFDAVSIEEVIDDELDDDDDDDFYDDIDEDDEDEEDEEDDEIDDEFNYYTNNYNHEHR